MKKKIRKIIIYFLCGCSIIVAFSMIMLLILKLIIGFDIIIYENIFYFYIVPSFLCTCIPFVICFELWGKDVLNYNAKALQYRIKFDDFDKLLSYIKIKLSELNYRLISSIKKDNLEEFVFVKELEETLAHRLTSNRRKIEFYIIIKTSELTKEFKENIDLELFKLMSKYYGKGIVTEGFYKKCDMDKAIKFYDSYGCEVISDEVYLNLVICVDIENANFQKLMNTKIEQGMYTYFLSTGIVFGKNKLYISKGDKNYYYRKLKKEFVQMMNISKDMKFK